MNGSSYWRTLLWTLIGAGFWFLVKKLNGI